MNKEIDYLLTTLAMGEELERIEAARALFHVEMSSPWIAKALDHAVVHDPSFLVRELALEALGLPLHRTHHRRVSRLDRKSRESILPLIDQWATEGLITRQVAALLNGRYALDMPPDSTVVESMVSKRMATSESAIKPKAPLKNSPINLRDREIETESAEIEVEQPFLEKQQFSLIETLVSEVTIKIALYLGAFLIVAAAVIFASIVEPARFPMLTLTIVGFLSSARISAERLPQGSFVLFLIGTLLIPIDALVYSPASDIQTSPHYWAAVMIVMSLVWGWGTYFYQSRFLSLMLYATFSAAVYLIASSYLSIESYRFLLLVALVAVIGLVEAEILGQWKGQHFFLPIFQVVQLQAIGILIVAARRLSDQAADVLLHINNQGSLTVFDAEEAALFTTWLLLGVFYFASNQLTRNLKKVWYVPVFPFLVIGCLMTPPVFIIEAISASPHQIAAVLWSWGILVVVASELFYTIPLHKEPIYESLFRYTSVLFLMAAPVVEYVTAIEYAIVYFLASSLVYFFLTYRHKEMWTWSVALIAAHLGYLVGVDMVRVAASPLFEGFALLVPAIAFLSLELTGRRYFRAHSVWTQPLLILGLVNTVWDVGILVSWYDDYPVSAAIVFITYGMFGALYAFQDDQREKNQAVVAWTGAVIAIYAAYINLLPNVNQLDFRGYILLAPALAYFSAELICKYYFRAGTMWTGPLLGAGLFNAGLGVFVTAFGVLAGFAGSAVIIFLIYGLVALLYTIINARSGEMNAAILTWTVSLLLFYVAYWFAYSLPLIGHLNLNPGFAILIPMLVFFSAELSSKLYFQMSQAWTTPLLVLGLFNAVLVVPVAILDGLRNDPVNAIFIFLICGLFAILYARAHLQIERRYAITGWTISLIALYIAYGFVHLLPTLERLNINPGFVALTPMLVFLSAELTGKSYLQVSQAWTAPLLVLGLFNAVLVVPVALISGLSNAPGSAAIIFLIYGLFSLLYGVVNDHVESGYVGTISFVLAVSFALVFYEQDLWVLPFAILAGLYYLSGVVADYFYDRIEWSQLLYRNGLALGIVIAMSAPTQGGSSAVLGMGMIATLYGAEAFRRRNVWFGVPSNVLFLGAYLMALQELKVTEPQFYSSGIALMAILTHYLVYRRTEDQPDHWITFTTGVLAQVILLGTSFIQMSGGLQFFFVMFFQSLILLAYGLVTRSLSFVVVPILFVVVGVFRVVFTVLAGYSTVVTLGCTGLGLVILGIIALVMREKIVETYEEISQGYIADQ